MGTARRTRLARERTAPDTLFIEQHKSVLDRPASVDVDQLPPIEPIHLLNEIRRQIRTDDPA